MRDRVVCLPSVCQTPVRAASERVEDDTGSCIIVRVSLTRISSNRIDELVYAVCVKRTCVRCHTISAEGVCRTSFFFFKDFTLSQKEKLGDGRNIL